MLDKIPDKERKQIENAIKDWPEHQKSRVSWIVTTAFFAGVDSGIDRAFRGLEKQNETLKSTK